MDEVYRTTIPVTEVMAPVPKLKRKNHKRTCRVEGCGKSFKGLIGVGLHMRKIHGIHAKKSNYYKKWRDNNEAKTPVVEKVQGNLIHSPFTGLGFEHKLKNTKGKVQCGDVIRIVTDYTVDAVKEYKDINDISVTLGLQENGEHKWTKV